MLNSNGTPDPVRPSGIARLDGGILEITAGDARARRGGQRLVTDLAATKGEA